LDLCRAEGADLASVHSIEEEEAISRFVLEGGIYSYAYFWIGLNNIDDELGYVWTDGKFLIF